MTGDPRTDVVAEQYARWVYPEPINDLPEWLKSNWQWFDPSHAHRMFWPDRGYQQGLRILVAGCGSNQAAVLAYTNPSAHVVGIDVSESSLRHHEELKLRFALRNLELHLLPIEEVGALNREFDLIVSTGVLHHLADPQIGMNALAGCLSRDGVLALMLYARYGRLGVEIMESVFTELGLRQDEASIAMVQQALATLPADHPVRSYLAFAPDLNFDAGLVDTFLHGRQRSYAVGDCLDLVESANLVFQDWFLKSPYEHGAIAGNDFFTAIAELPDRSRWSVMERINTRNACHFFTACRADRDPHRYLIDFNSPDAAEYRPELRLQCMLDGTDLIKPGGRLPLTPTQRALAEHFDGRTTIEELARRVVTHVADCLAYVRLLWQQDFVAIAFGQST